MNTVLVCACADAHATRQAVVDDAVDALARAEASFHVLPDLCRLAARQPACLTGLRTPRVAACAARSVAWLFQATGGPAPDETIDLHDGLCPGKLSRLEQWARESDGDVVPLAGPASGMLVLHRAGLDGALPPRRVSEIVRAATTHGLVVGIVERLDGLAKASEDGPVFVLTGQATVDQADGQENLRVAAPGARSPEQLVAEACRWCAQRGLVDDDWTAWYPVIDRDRCTSCGQCMGFCLFGVYERDDDGTVRVAHPDQCKNLCPACARVCPASAIVFPRHESPRINGQSDAGDTARVDVDNLAGGDVYDRLRQRGNDAPCACSQAGPAQRLQEQLDIPPEVLDSLSDDDRRRIARKASRPDGPCCDAAGEQDDSAGTDGCGCSQP
jgi:NAD-dependent dihydropyrimidine dehydrogenase PreA subunit